MRLAVFLTLFFALVACDSGSSHYSTYQEAKADKLFFDRWLPDILPQTTTDIVTNNDLKTNTSQGHFTIPERDLPNFIYKLQPLNNRTYTYGALTDPYYWEFQVKENGRVDYFLKSRLG